MAEIRLTVDEVIIVDHFVQLIGVGHSVVLAQSNGITKYRIVTMIQGDRSDSYYFDCETIEHRAREQIEAIK